MKGNAEIFTLARRLIDVHGADLSMTITPCKFDSLWATCSSYIFDAEVAHYIEDQTKPLYPASFELVCAQGSMSALTYRLMKSLRAILPVPEIVSSRLLQSYKSTLLHHAVFEGNISACLWLLKKNADPTMTNHQGDTPLMVAEKKGYVGIQKVLLDFLKGRRT